MKLSLENVSALAFALSFLTVLVLTPLLIRKLKNMRFTGPDMNKEGKPQIPKFGGIVIALGFVLSILLAIQFYFTQNVELMLAAVLTIVLISFLGFIDDVLKIRDIYRVILPAFAALPLMVAKAGTTSMNLPIIGVIDFNLGLVNLPIVGDFTLNLYVLLLIPLGVVACSNLVNLLAGFNGLEIGSGIIIMLALLAALLLNPTAGSTQAIIIVLAMLGACSAFLMFNWYPAKIFPGNITTYILGAAIVVVVVLGNIEKVGIIALTPQIIEFILKARGFFNAENFATPKGNKLFYEGRTESLTHFVMKKFKPTEVQLVLILFGFQTVCAIAAVASLYV